MKLLSPILTVVVGAFFAAPVLSADPDNPIVVATNSGWAPYFEEAPIAGKTDDENFGLAVGASGKNLAATAQGDFSDSARLEFFSDADQVWKQTEYGNFGPGFQTSDAGFYHVCYSVAVSGDNAVLGQPSDAYLTDETYRGSAVFFHRVEAGWIATDLVMRPFDAEGMGFGCRVALSNNLAVVTAPLKDQGSVFILEFNGASWDVVQTLHPSDPAVSCFGCALAMDENTIVIGAPGLSGPSLEDASEQSAFVYQRAGRTWNEVAQLRAPDLVTGDDFAETVAVSGSVIAVGAPLKSGKGAVYLFSQSGSSWILDTEFVETSTNALFGSAIALEGERFLVGEQGRQRAILFNRKAGAWKARSTFTLDTGAGTLGRFAYSVALDGGIAVVGSPSEGKGRVHILRDDDLFSCDFESKD